MVQINDDFYEDLTPESITSLLKAMQETAKTAAGPDEGFTGHITGVDKVYGKDGVKIPAPGPMSGRKTCENIKGLTNLTSEMWGPEVFRKDL